MASIESKNAPSPKKKLTLFLLCYFFGVFGVHRFYTGYYVSGALMLLTLGGLGAWWFLDLLLILLDKLSDEEGRPVVQWV